MTMEIIRDGHCVRIIVKPSEEEALLCKIAAAEALYDALKSAVPYLKNLGGPKALDKALNALARAEGRA
jgi:hypothetical protein